MKTLLLLRHAKSSWKDATLADFERPLNNRGKRAAETIGTYLKKKISPPDLILSSPAARARETLDLLVKAARWSVEVRFDQRIYGAGATRLVEIVSQIENDRKSVLIIGHNPGLEELLSWLTGTSEIMPTATVAKLSLKSTKWANTVDKPATLELLIRPKNLEAD